MQGILLIESINELATTPIIEFERKLKEKFIALKVIPGYRWDNTTLLVSNLYGNWFSMMLHRNSCAYGSIKHRQLQETFGKDVDTHKVYKATFWDYKGAQQIYCVEFVIEDYNKPIPKKIINVIIEELENYSKGNIKCSDCGKNIKRTDIGGNYFAGSYCQDCWLGNVGRYENRGGWKKVEAEESYN